MRPSQNVPLVTIAMVGAAIAASVVPTLQRSLIFDRGAIEAGQWWRLLTGSWVHFSADHLFFDSIAFGLAGWMMERENRCRLALLCATATLTIGVVIFAQVPQVSQYGGLSGVACAVVAYLAARGLRESTRSRWFFATAFLALVAKVSWEWATGTTVFVVPRSSITVLPLAHGVGVLVGAVLAAVTGRVTAGGGRGTGLFAQAPNPPARQWRQDDRLRSNEVPT